MNYDFNDAESNNNTGDLIPKGTVAPVILTIRPGGVGDGGWLSTSERSEYQWLDCEFTVTAGPFAKRKFWTLMMAGHATPNEEKVERTLEITRSKLRGILESARAIDPNAGKDPNDKSPQAEAARLARKINSIGDFDRMEFVAKIGVELGRNGYSDKNVFDKAVAVTSPEYAEAKAGAAAPAPAAQAAPTANVPAWAQ